MKKQFLLINIILIIFNISCIHQKKNENDGNKLTTSMEKQKIDKVQLIVQTRGINNNTIFSPDSIEATSRGETTKSPIVHSYWEEISKEAAAINLSEIANLKSPTTGRYSDQALSVTIVITSNGVAFTSSSFDAGMPPKELEALYKTIGGKSGKKR